MFFLTFFAGCVLVGIGFAEIMLGRPMIGGAWLMGAAAAFAAHGLVVRFERRRARR